jgi:hypothetical protein
LVGPTGIIHRNQCGTVDISDNAGKAIRFRALCVEGRDDIGTGGQLAELEDLCGTDVAPFSLHGDFSWPWVTTASW